MWCFWCAFIPALPLVTAGILFAQGIPAPSRAEINLAFPTITKFDDTQPQQNQIVEQYAEATWKACDVPDLAAYQSNPPLTRPCHQKIIQKLVRSGVTGVRFMFNMPDGINGVGPNATFDTTWFNGLRNLFQDLYCGGDPVPCSSRTQPAIPYITPTLGWDGKWTEFAAGDSRLRNFCNQAIIQSRMRFSPVAPFGEVWTSDGHGGYTWQIDGYDTNAPQQVYDCSPAPPRDPPQTGAELVFVGWDKIGDFVQEVLRTARYPFGPGCPANCPDARGLTVEELDAQNEIILDSFPVRARLIMDHTHNDRPVLGNLRDKMALYYPNSNYRVTYSVWAQTPNAQTPNATPVDCGSYYGDSARIVELSMLTAAIGGGEFGKLAGDPLALLNCSQGHPQSSLAHLPISYPTQPNIVDVHMSPCILGANECDQSEARIAAVADEAKQDFNSILRFLHTFSPTVVPPSEIIPGLEDTLTDERIRWRCAMYNWCQPNLSGALVMVGETFGKTVAVDQTRSNCPVLDGSGHDTGIKWDVRFPGRLIAGLASSSMNGRTLSGGGAGVILRPWEYLQDWHSHSNPDVPPDLAYDVHACSPIDINPPYTPSEPLAPTADSISPVNGSGPLSQTFTLKYSDGNGVTTLRYAGVLFNTTLDTNTGCYVRYDRSTQTLSLMNASGACSIGSGWAHVENGITLTLTVPLVFTAGFAGVKTVWLQGWDAGGLSSGWKMMGTWTIAGLPQDLYLQNLTLTSGTWLYQAVNSVVAENGVTISMSASVTFQAGNFVRLGPGFQATAGSAATTFHAFIQ